MDKGNIYKKYEDIIRRDYIGEVIKRFERVRELLFYKGNLNDVVDGYLNYDRMINDINSQIKRMNDEKRIIEDRKFELLNRSVLELRKEGKLIDWLDRLEINELRELKNIVKIDYEYKVVDDKKLNELKMIRGNKIY